jgi:two-component system response regulator YesN
LFRVLVVDDEKEIRNGLVAQLPWDRLGVGEILAADDGDTALEVIARRKPDLVVTDIRMPRVSGLELLRQLNRDRFDGSVIVISGYEDFHYAKQVMKWGVNDYLLKPLDPDELVQSISDSLSRLEERKRHRMLAERDGLFDHLNTALPNIREHLLQDLIERAPLEREYERWMQALRQVGLEWMATGRLRLLVVGIDDLKAIVNGKPGSERELLLFSAGNMLEYYLNGRLRTEIAVFRSRQELWVAVIDCSGSGRDAADIPEALAAEIPKALLKGAKIRASVGIAQAAGRFIRLADMYREAADKLMMRKVAYRHGIALRPYNGPLANPREVVALLTGGTEEEIRLAAEDYPQLVRTWNIRHPKDLQQRTFIWMLGIFRAAKKEGWQDLWWEQNPIGLWEELERYDTLESLKRRVAHHLLLAAESMKGGSANPIVLEAERYIKQHYADNLTLQAVAEAIHVTPAWLSKLFKRETGMTFLEYLTDVRLKRAVELLQDVQLKVYQIGYMVGYQDPVYFSRLFKKQYGCTPQEYRSGRGYPGGD